MTFGYSRDDVSKFLPIYLAQGILQNDPFEVKTFVIILKHVRVSCTVIYGCLVLKVQICAYAAIVMRTYFCLIEIQVLDQKGVGELIKVATERGRKTKPTLKVTSLNLNSLDLVHSIFKASEIYLIQLNFERF